MPAPGQPLDCVSWITIKYHSDGSLSTSGNIGDVPAALAMLAHAADAIRGQLRPRNEIVVPNRDVVVAQDPRFPTRPIGDMAPSDRGDLA